LSLKAIAPRPPLRSPLPLSPARDFRCLLAAMNAPQGVEMMKAEIVFVRTLSARQPPHA
jgi:hypothetical protein